MPWHSTFYFPVVELLQKELFMQHNQGKQIIPQPPENNPQKHRMTGINNSQETPISKKPCNLYTLISHVQLSQNS